MGAEVERLKVELGRVREEGRSQAKEGEERVAELERVVREERDRREKEGSGGWKLRSYGRR